MRDRRGTLRLAWRLRVARWRAAARADPTLPRLLVKPPSDTILRLSWLRRANLWLHELNHKRLARRKLRKRRASERAWLVADDPRRPEVARALQERLAARGGDVKFSLIVWPGSDSPRATARWDAVRSMHTNWELLWPQGVPPPQGIDAHLQTYDAQGAAGAGLVDIALRSATGSHVALIPEHWEIAPHALHAGRGDRPLPACPVDLRR